MRPVRQRSRAVVWPRAVAVLLIASAVAGCGERDATGSERGLTAEAFTQIVVELREAEREAVETDSAAAVFARRKAEILERHGTSEEEIRAFAESAAEDIPASADLWEEISKRLRRAAPTDSL